MIFFTLIGMIFTAVLATLLGNWAADYIRGKTGSNEPPLPIKKEYRRLIMNARAERRKRKA